MTSSGEVRSVNGYQVLTLKLPALPSYREPAWHHLYLRRHEPRRPQASDDRALFAVNVPIDATESHFRHLWQQLGAGTIEAVQLDGGPAGRPVTTTTTTTTTEPTVAARSEPARKRKRPGPAEKGDLPTTWDRPLHPSGGTAVIVFVDRAGLHASLGAIRRRQGSTLHWAAASTASVPELGSHRMALLPRPPHSSISLLGDRVRSSAGRGAHAIPSTRLGYQVHHRLRFPSRATLQSSVDVYLTRHAALEVLQARRAKRLRQEPDADGFVTVTRGGRMGPARPEEAQLAADRQTKKRGAGSKNFYRFQLREERKKAQGELLRRFDQDRRTVDAMRTRRLRRMVRVTRLAPSRPASIDLRRLSTVMWRLTFDPSRIGLLSLSRSEGLIVRGLGAWIRPVTGRPCG